MPKLTLEELKYIARFKGCCVYDYSKAETLLILLDLDERAEHSSALAFVDDCGNKYIFIDDTMPQEKQAFAIAHELGHIELNHLPTNSKRLKRKREAEADEYATKLLNRGSGYIAECLKSAL